MVADAAMSNGKKTRVFFIADKWCAGNINFGLSEWEGNLWASLKVQDWAEVVVFNLDEHYRLLKKKGDSALLKKIKEFRPELVCLIIYKMPGSDFNVPEWSTLDEIKDILKIPMVAVWGDLEIQEQVNISKALLPYVKCNAATASEAAVARINNAKKFVYTWVPKNPAVFYDGGQRRNIDISYVGSPKDDRLERVNYLIRHGLPVVYTGGERQEHLSTMDYAEMFRKSKLTISFSRAVFSHVINARPFEAMLCGAMVLEQDNFETPKLFTPFVDYVPYFSDSDLLEKAKYFLKNDDERRAIAHNGYVKASTLYSAKRFWRFLIDQALGGSNKEACGKKDTKLHAADLTRYPFWRAVRLRSLDRLCSSRAGFFLYFNLHKVANFYYWRRSIAEIVYELLQNNLSPKHFDKIKKIKRKVLGSRK